MQNRQDMFETFNDGLCAICRMDEDGNAGSVVERLRFQERTIGVKRYYEAKTAKVQVDRLVRVPYQKWLTTEYLAVIDGEVYELEQVQVISDTAPKSNDISLHLARQRRVVDGAV